MTSRSEASVLIVDDDSAIRDSLSALLESRGFSARSFRSGVEFLSAYQPSWRGCLLLDVRMPVMDGLEVQRELGLRRSDLSILIMTAHGDVPLAVRAMKAGAADFLEKPIEPSALFAALAVCTEAGPRPASASSREVQLVGERLARLTERERQVLEQLVAGRPNKVIGYELQISPRTVELHRARVMEKMEAQSLSHLVRMALSAGILPST